VQPELELDRKDAVVLDVGDVVVVSLLELLECGMMYRNRTYQWDLGSAAGSEDRASARFLGSSPMPRWGVPSPKHCAWDNQRDENTHTAIVIQNLRRRPGALKAL
jgi:hypothetical protein